MLCNSPAQIVHTLMPLSASNIIWYLPKVGEALWWDGGNSGPSEEVVAAGHCIYNVQHFFL